MDRLQTDLGEQFDLTLDPPIVVLQEVHRAVQRWRWAQVASRYPELTGEAACMQYTMETLWKVLGASGNGW